MYQLFSARLSYMWKLSIEVFFHWGHLPLRSSSIEFVLHWGRLPLRSSSIKVVFRWARLSLMSYFLEVVFHWNRLPLRLSSIEDVLHLGCLLLKSFSIDVVWFGITSYVIENIFELNVEWMSTGTGGGLVGGIKIKAYLRPAGAGVWLSLAKIPC